MKDCHNFVDNLCFKIVKTLEMYNCPKIIDIFILKNLEHLKLRNCF